ncbi:exonuclease domain-containing protein [Chitinilyticum litopenaei]|uniref:exonuclease domain-containing protein n=1 Tax=Chitinilyticum litopenaei TaxID=1121276 RepID=UPI000400EA85|nr:exonuclease domain-containing protein [Chitinilyticum litopenaei]
MSNPYFSSPLVLVDLETTGAHPARDRITEIGIVEITADGVREWSSLVNPQQPIPAFIEQLTGISDAMVAEAPTFAELADAVLARLQGRVFVAHNARFDYGFLRQEFQRLGMKFRADVLCTVKLSRQLYPQQFKHSLDALIARHGLSVSGGRHRALTDAALLGQFLAVARAEHGEARLAAEIAELIRRPPLPPGVDPQVVDELPETPGVYQFFDASGNALFIARAPNIRKRVLQHFASQAKAGQVVGKLNRDMLLAHQLNQQLARIAWEEVSGELGMLLLEQRLLRQWRPRLNAQPRSAEDLCVLELADEGGLLRVQRRTLGDLPELGDWLFGPFRSKREANTVLGKLADAQGLCRQVLGLEVRPKGGKPCAACALGQCRGVCAAREPAAAHNARLLAALARHRLPAWPYPGPVGLAEGPDWAPVLHVLDRWCYLGSVHDVAEVPELLASPRPQFDPDSYKLIQKALKTAQERIRRLDGLQAGDGHA